MSKEERACLKAEHNRSLVDYALKFKRDSLQAMEIRHKALNQMHGMLII